MGSSCETWEGFSSFLMTDDLLDVIGASRERELRLCGGSCSSSGFCSRGFTTEGNDSGVYLLVSEEERNELPNLDSVGVPKNVRFGDGTLLYKSMDCLKHQSTKMDEYLEV